MEGYLDDIDAISERQFLLAARRLADSLSYGTDHSPFRGAGVEYVQSRPYQSGDNVRAMDWRVTARTGRFHVKEYEAPKRLDVYLLLDTSASMTISSRQRSKYSLAVQIAAGLALACLERVSPVGVLGVGERDFLYEPSLSRGQIMQWLAKLRRYRYDEGTTLGERILQLAPSLRHRVMIICLSDMHDPRALPGLKRLRQEHDCIVLRLEDPAEGGMPHTGFLRAREAESGRRFIGRGKKARADIDGTDNELKKAGIDHLRILTHEPFVHRLRYFLQSRGVLGRRAR